MAIIERDRVKLFYEDQGHDTDAPPLMLVHGWTCCLDHLEPQAAHFAPTARIVVVDLRGHGQSDVVGPFNIETFADDVAWLISAISLDRPVVIGHSMGGMIAVEIAATRPELVRAAVALDSPFSPGGALAEVVSALLEALSGPDYKTAQKAMIDAMFGRHDSPERAAQVAAVMMGTSPDVMREAIASVMHWDGEERLRASRVPVMTVHAAPGSPMDANRLVPECPHLTVGQTVGAGHFIQLEVADQVNPMLERFLKMVG